MSRARLASADPKWQVAFVITDLTIMQMRQSFANLKCRINRIFLKSNVANNPSQLQYDLVSVSPETLPYAFSYFAAFRTFLGFKNGRQQGETAFTGW